MTTPQVTGVKEALKTLRKLDPEMRAQFNTDAKRITQPAVNDAQNAYGRIIFPSGTLRRWAPGGRVLFPLKTDRLARRVRFKTDTRTKARSVFKIVNADGGATVLEWAGARTTNSLGRAFDSKGHRAPRVVWPATESHIDDIRDGLKDSIEQVEKYLNRELG